MENTYLTEDQEDRLIRLCNALIDQSAARIIVPPQKRETGYWFGGGSVAEQNDVLYLCGRYRNFGDSRSGTDLGTRGCELAVFRSPDRGVTWGKILSFSKDDLSREGREVLSIEGSAFRKTNRDFELYVSSEKLGRNYPSGFEEYKKPGTGIWSIDVLRAGSVEELEGQKPVQVLECADLRYIHVKDPAVYQSRETDYLFFCTHPFGWSSSNTAYMEYDPATAGWGDPHYNHFPRGTTWDAAASRATCLVDVPRIGTFSEGPEITLMFYDGAESIRNLDEHAKAIKRPRGYSCEELGGVGYAVDRDFYSINRLSRYLPQFTSPHGTGASRYIDIFVSREGYYVTWEQSQPDFSQPLVMNHVSHDRVAEILSE